MIKRPHMRKVRSENTKPEIIARRIILDLGYRGYRVNYKKLPGRPDIVFTKRKKTIFIHGCFWHGHDCRAGRNRPNTNRDYWEPKLMKNKARDGKRAKELKSLGWDVLTIWECQLKDVKAVKTKIQNYLCA